MKIFIMDENFRSLYVIDVFKSLIWTERFNGYGDFEFYTPISNDVLMVVENIQKNMQEKDDYYAYLDESKNAMIIENIEITADVETGNHLIISGRGLESLLERRIIWNTTTISGNLQNGVKKLITDAMINPDISDRKISNFVFKESDNEYVKSLTLKAQYTGDNLYDAILSICDMAKLGFDVRINKNNQLEFAFVVGEDRSFDQIKNPYVIFSKKFENISNSDYIESGKTFKNVTLVAGEGEGADRVRLTVGSASGFRRKELYTDARDIQTENFSQQLEEDMEALENHKENLSNLQQKLVEEEKAFFEVSSKYAKELTEHNEFQTDYLNRISSFNNRITYYNGKIDSYKNSLNDKQKDAFSTRQRLTYELDPLVYLIDQCNKKIDEYNDKLRNEQKITYTKIVQYEEGIEAEDAKIPGYEEQKKILEEVISNAEKELPNLETQLKKYEDMISKYKDIISDDEEKISKETADFDKVTSEFLGKETEYNQITSAYESEITSVTQQISEYESKVIADQNEINALYAALLNERGSEKLSEKQYIKAFTGEVDSINMFVYGTDFYIGDIVQIVNEYGMEAKVRVTELVRAQDGTGYKTYPTFEFIEE